MTYSIDSKKPLGLNEWAYRTIKMRILDQNLLPGDQLNIETLSEELNISRTPIREALLRLRQNGLVESISRVGFFVKGITKSDFEDIFELRQIIESYAVQQFSEKANSALLAELCEIHEHCTKAAVSGQVREYNDWDVRLHDLFINHLGNRKIMSIYNNLGDLLYRLRVYALNNQENIQLSLKEHGQLVQALNAHDTALARKCMETHIIHIRDRMRTIVDFQE